MKKITSPTGIAVWPSLTTATAYKDQGPKSYECTIRLNPSDEGVAEFIEALEEAHAAGPEAVNEQRSRHGEKPLTAAQLKKVGAKPWREELDRESGEPTGHWVVKSKLKEFRAVRGEDVAQRPALFDGAGQPWPIDVPIWSGSKLRISVEPRPYFVGAVGYGISLQLKGVQVLSVVNGSNESLDADAFGFDTDGPAQPAPAPKVEEVVEAAEEDAFGGDF